MVGPVFRLAVYHSLLHLVRQPVLDDMEGLGSQDLVHVDDGMAAIRIGIAAGDTDRISAIRTHVLVQRADRRNFLQPDPVDILTQQVTPTGIPDAIAFRGVFAQSRRC